MYFSSLLCYQFYGIKICSLLSFYLAFPFQRTKRISIIPKTRKPEDSPLLTHNCFFLVVSTTVVANSLLMGGFHAHWIQWLDLLASQLKTTAVDLVSSLTINSQLTNHTHTHYITTMASGDYRVADISLADFGRREIELAEHEVSVVIRNVCCNGFLGIFLFRCLD